MAGPLSCREMCGGPRRRPRGVRYAERFRTSYCITEERYAPGSSTLRNRAGGGGARGDGLQRYGAHGLDQVVQGSWGDVRCLGAHLHLRAELEARRGDLPGGGWLLRSQRGLLRAGARLGSEGGFAPLPNLPPKDRIARAKPALEAAYLAWRRGPQVRRIRAGAGAPLPGARSGQPSQEGVMKDGLR